MAYVIGLDLGQATDFSALCALNNSDVEDTSAQPPRASDEFRTGIRTLRHYACTGLKRWPLGTSYPIIVDEVVALLLTPVLQGACLVVDASGVGRPVVDLLRDKRMTCKMVPVVITSGLNESGPDKGYWHVAKQILISTTQVVLQQRRLKFAKGLTETKTLVRELENYRVKVTQSANEVFNAREGEHDDLVLAAALACWWGERPKKRLWVR